MKRTEFCQHQRFGRLAYLGEAQPKVTPGGQSHRYAYCLCDCGNEKTIRSSHLVSGLIVSCGCYNRELINQGKAAKSQAENFNSMCKANGGGCIEWQGRKSFDGYGRVWFRGAEIGAHRVSYIMAIGEIPDGLYVCHTCDNRLCVNPEHLWLGTHIDNMNDMRSKGRGVGGENNQKRRYSGNETSTQTVSA